MVSVIIPTRNAEKYIHDLVTSLKRQTVHSEIIVIDSSSTDRTVSIADSLGARTKIIVRGCFDHGGTRNLAAHYAKGDTLVFLTQDALPANEYLIENLIKPLNEPEIAASYGRQIPRTDAKPTERFARLFNYPNTPFINDRESISKWGIKTFFFSNVCSAIRRREFEEINGFTENIIMNEDMLLASRLIMRGHKIAYAPEAMVIHSHNYSLGKQFKRYFDIGVFLRKNAKTLNNARVNDIGTRFLKEEVKYLVNNKAYEWFPYVIVEALSKYVGYRLGLYHSILPVPVRKVVSMHSCYWQE